MQLLKVYTKQKDIQVFRRQILFLALKGGNHTRKDIRGNTYIERTEAHKLNYSWELKDTNN